ncbi:TBC1 domain family member 14 [Phytophthora cinnamomi]|uniref:TBC1 domain family member 14 n=1 Tax=Phytophthora cinnamomi TaxID=4785 RepID=UPI00355A4439|nr:TBC1 domain family member 14 [Phytophthora cinnamomi]
MSVAPPHELVLQGYLHKQAGVGAGRLDEVTYSTKSGRKPRLLLSLGDVQVIDDQNQVRHPGNYVFVLQTPSRKLFLSATTEQERRYWVAELRGLLSGGYDGVDRAVLDSAVLGRNPSSAAKTSTAAATVLNNQRKAHKRASKERRVERRRQQLPKLKRTFSETWLEEVFVLPSGGTREDVPLLDALCFAGIPKELRGQDAATIQASVSAKTSTATEVSIAEMLVAHGERSIKLVNVDMPRTFGHHPLFQPGAEGTERTTEVLEAYICYRPDLGYVQGMSYLAATLCFHMDNFTAFKALVALMSSSLLFDMFRLEATRTFHYIEVYNQILEYELPALAAHFQEIGIDAQMYAVDWALTLYTRSLPLDLALRIWDVYVLLGTPFFFQASMGLLSLFQDSLLSMEAEDIMRLLHSFPKNTSSRQLFEAIASVSLSCQEITELLAGGKLWSPDEARQVPVKFPETYE